MHFHVAAIGQRVPRWVDDAWQDYARRFPRAPRIELKALPAEKRHGGADLSRIVPREGARLLAAVPDAACMIALDERGRQWSTKQLAAKVERWMAGGRDVWFLIGGADGLSADCLEQAENSWSLGRLTLPHALVRVVLIEQLYRALSLVSGHPYHRE
ncbi:MAG: 23S rRNA (pseudouridine(1915)-N(3))-methyltransferase RlmH [Xanthomonadales bacterium]|nr:23S rRNA (pseudouridine(1915)-N(3))-methyltransferase RlmH [Xanthomonadales bacterium]